MSILIKGIDMPKERLMITIFPDGTWCGLDNVFHAGDIVEIPKHGRLIDAKPLKIRLGQRYSDDKRRVMEIAKETIDTAPTIIESEE